MTTRPRMKCGHTANADKHLEDGTVIPACVICFGITPGADEIDPDPPSLEGRMMACSYNHKRNGEAHDPALVPSDPQAAFFEHRPEAEYDLYYCGCWGWD